MFFHVKQKQVIRFKQAVLKDDLEFLLLIIAAFQHWLKLSALKSSACSAADGFKIRYDGRRLCCAVILSEGNEIYVSCIEKKADILG